MTALAQAFNVALLHFIWQGLAIGLLLGIALFLLRRSSANARYVVSCVALVALALAPIVTTVVMYDPPSRLLLSSGVSSYRAATDFLDIRSATSPGRTMGLAGLQGWVLPIWAIGVSLFALRLMWCWGHTAALRRTGTAAEDSFVTMVSRLAERLGVTQKIRILMSSVAEVPSVIGWMRPVLLLPVAVAAGLTPEQLEALIAHEIAHIRRHDYLVNLAQTVVETVLFYHPVVWWVSSKIRYERELCCDDLAVATLGDAAGYARALAKLEELRVFQPSLAMGAANGPLFHRIERLLGGDGRSSGPSRLACAVGLMIGIACWAFTITVAQERNRVRNGDFVEDFFPPMPPSAPMAPIVTMVPMPPMPAMPPMPPMPVKQGLPYFISLGELKVIPQDPDNLFRALSASESHWVVFRGDRVISNASDSEERDARASRQSAGGGDFLWFAQDGKTYVSQDKATVDRVAGLHRAVDAGYEAQDFLESQIRKMSQQQQELLQQFDRMSEVAGHSELQADLLRLQNQLQAANRPNERLSNISRDILELRARIDKIRAEDSDVRFQLLQQQMELVKIKSGLAMRQAEATQQLGLTISRIAPQVQEQLREAISSGKAKPVK